MKIARSTGLFAAACLALAVAQTPAHAGGDITNFHVKNCTSDRVFVCSFDKTDSLMDIPYTAKGLKPGDRKEFGCASLGHCKVIIGVSMKNAKHTLSSGMEKALAAGSAAGGGVAASGGTYSILLAGGGVAAADAATVALVGTVGAVILGTLGGGAIAAIEIADGWSDGKVCNEVKKAARKANLKPKHTLHNGKNYRVIEKYAVNKDGDAYVNLDGTAVFAYETTHKLNNCPAPLKTQLVPN